jgi:hypothetical protein
LQVNRQELVRSASGRVRRGRRAAGRVVVSALGFGVAYYFDTENGGLRRKRLHETLHRVVADIKSARTSEDGGASLVFHPVLHPGLHARRGEGRARGGTERVEAVRRPR